MDDGEWNDRVLIEVIANPRLNPHQQEIVAREYGMTKGPSEKVWSENIRKCMVGYFAVHYRLDLEENENPLHTPLVLKDLPRVKPFLFGNAARED